MVLTSGSGQLVGEEVLTSGAHLSARKRGRGDTDSGMVPAGPWADSDAGPDGFPEVQFHFYLVYFFSFSVFLFLL
jgi:hypothetical protein